MLRMFYRQLEGYLRLSTSERMKGLVERLKTTELRLVSFKEKRIGF